MGFRMIREHRASSSWILHALHLGLGLSIPLLILVLVGCKKIKEEKADYGPEVPGEQIDLALSKAVHGASLEHVALGQYVDYVVVRRLENEETTTTMGGTRVEVFHKEELEDRIKFTLKIFRSERAGGNSFETRVTEEPLEIKKPSPQFLITDSPMASGEITASSLAAEHAVGAMKKVSRTTYHRLRESTGTIPAPAKAAERADCGGLNPCEIPVRYVQFDLVQWFDDGSSQKVSLDFGFSTATPYLPFGEYFDQFTGLLVVDCRSTYIPIENRTVYVRDCMTLEDFQK